MSSLRESLFKRVFGPLVRESSSADLGRDAVIDQTSPALKACAEDKKTTQFSGLILENSELGATLQEKGGVILVPAGINRLAYPSFRLLIPIEINANDTESLSTVSDDLEVIVSWDLLQRVGDYRKFLSGCFGKLKVGGRLILVVPNQYTCERRLLLPSRIDSSHLRLYSLASLLSEVEEALAPLEYVVKLASQLEATGEGEEFSDMHDILLVIEKTAQPDWAPNLLDFDRPAIKLDRPTSILPLKKEEEGDYHVVRPDRGAFDKLVILKLDHRGDFLMAKDAFKIVREAFPTSELTVVCGSWNTAEAKNMGYFEKVVGFDFFVEDMSTGQRVKSEDELSSEFQQLLGGLAFDIALDLRMTGDTRRLLRLVNARHKAGFDDGNHFSWLDISMNVPSATRAGRAEQKFLSAMQFSTREGHHNAFDISFEDLAPHRSRRDLIWGPYIDLPAGHYEFEVFFDKNRGKGWIQYDVAAENGTVILCEGVVNAEFDAVTLFVVIGQSVRNLELRIFVSEKSKGAVFCFRGLRIKKIGAFDGLHQKEAMALLAHLVAMRSRDAFLTSVEQ